MTDTCSVLFMEVYESYRAIVVYKAAVERRLIVSKGENSEVSSSDGCEFCVSQYVARLLTKSILYFVSLTTLILSEAEIGNHFQCAKNAVD